MQRWPKGRIITTTTAVEVQVEVGVEAAEEAAVEGEPLTPARAPVALAPEVRSRG
jgi:hypothetical protein